MSANGPSRRLVAMNNSAAFGAKRTFSEPRLRNRIDESALSIDGRSIHAGSPAALRSRST
jgi:hypothetical protein